MQVVQLPDEDRFGRRIHRQYLYLGFAEESGTIFVKIGHTSDPGRRFYTISGQGPLEIPYFRFVRISYRDRARAAEQWMHGRLEKYRAVGEWFRFAPDEKAEFQAACRDVLRQFAQGETWNTVDMRALRELGMLKQIQQIRGAIQSSIKLAA